LSIRFIENGTKPHQKGKKYADKNKKSAKTKSLCWFLRF